MNKLFAFYNEFKEKSGNSILIASVISRVLSFFASYVALQFIPNVKLGLAIYAINIIALIMPISGFGAYQGLLRYGALLENKSEKNQLYSYVLKRGSFYSVILILITIIISGILTYYLPSSKPYLIGISLSIFTLFLLESIKTHFRILHQNKLFAKTEIVYNIISFLMVFIGSFYFQEIGYVTALVLAPLFTFLLFYSKSRKDKDLTSKFVQPGLSFWKYSIFTGLSNVATQLLIVLDIILIGVLLKDPEKVTIYKYLSLIPFSLLFLPRVVITTDFVTLTKNYLNSSYIKEYIQNYLVLFSVFSITVLLFLYLFSEWILSLFGVEFIQYQLTFRILLFGISSVLILRGLFGNLLSSIGKSSINYWISSIGILINLVSNYYLIPKYGLLGAALTSSIIMWITSLLSVFYYYYYIKLITKN